MRMHHSEQARSGAKDVITSRTSCQIFFMLLIHLSASTWFPELAIFRWSRHHKVDQQSTLASEEPWLSMLGMLSLGTQ
jgi:hypothetical protein